MDSRTGMQAGRQADRQVLAVTLTHLVEAVNISVYNKSVLPQLCVIYYENRNSFMTQH